MEDTQDLNLTFSGCGFLGIYHIGVMACLKENAVDFLKRVKCFGGASAGAFAAIGLVVDLDISEVTESVIRLSKRAKSFSLGPLHPSFQIVKTVRRAFEKMLPDNAHEIASGKVHISLTRVPDLQNVIVSKFFSKEDLIEALVATSFVPLYSGILPAVFRGKYYVDGAISDNLPQHFKDGETITVSPFSGESDICPQDTSSNDVHIELKNTSMQFTLHNFYRFSCALFPPHEDVMSDICWQGYRDTLRFLKEHYPDTLTKVTLRSPSTSLSLPPNKLSSSSGHCTCCGHGSSGTMGSQAALVCSFCGNGLREQVSLPTDEDVEEGESKLSRVLCEARNNALKERELWSCIVIRRSIHLVKVLSKPCVITVQQFLTMLKTFLELLAKMEGKTRNAHLDKVLSVLNMMMHTYRDRHEVEHWRTSRFAITETSLKGEGSKSVKSTYECIQAIPAPQSTYKYENGCSTENDAQDIGVNQDSTNDARVLLSNDLVRFQLQECLQECVAGNFMCLENDDDLTSAHITEDLFEKGDGPADHTPCCKPVRVDLVDTDIAEANSNEEYAFIFSQ